MPRSLPLLLGFAVAAFVVGCDEEDPITCSDPLRFVTGALNAQVEVGTEAEAQTAFTGTVTITFDCEATDEIFVVASGALVDSDQTTKIFDLTGEFAQGEASIEASACTGTHATKSFTVTLAGPKNEDMVAHCGRPLWVEMMMRRQGCDGDDAAEQRFNSQATIQCP
jgi:hypothetical protein